MKRKIFAICLVAILGITAIAGATLAYFTDKDTADNVFTIGNVDIKLLESKLHRDNDKASDDDIIADAEAYQDEYLAEAGKLMVPGRWVKKAPYVQNVGTNAAYVRVTVAVPENVDPLIQIALCSEGKDAGAFTTSDPVKKDGMIYTAFTFTEALEPGEVTYYAPFWQFKLDDALDNEDLKGLQGLDVEHIITVTADAIQSEGFDSAEKAFAAFDAQYSANN